MKVSWTRKKHSKKEIGKALQYAEQQGWRIEVGGSHAWGKIYCPKNDNECRCGEFCISSIWSAPHLEIHQTMPNKLKELLITTNENIEE